MADLTTIQAEEQAGLVRRFVDEGDATYAELVEAFVLKYPRARVGQYWYATSPAPGTGIAQGIVAAYGATTPIMTVFNTAAAGGNSLYLDYIKLICSAAGASSTSGQLAMFLDQIDRYTSGGTRLTTTASNAGSSLLTSSPKARIDFGVLVAAAAGANAKQVGRDAIKTQAAPCWAVGDEVFVKFDQVDVPAGPTNGAASNVYPVPRGPVVIAPGHSFLLHLWNPANAVTAPSWEVEMGWWEAP